MGVINYNKSGKWRTVFVVPDKKEEEGGDGRLDLEELWVLRGCSLDYFLFLQHVIKRYL